MKRELRAIPEAPLHLADRHGSENYSNTLDYIPGTALRGALAMAYLNKSSLQRQVTQRLQSIGWSFQNYFQWLFLSGLVRFPNLYPRKERPSFAIPLSARSCKRFSGFVAEDTPVAERPHGVLDVLLYHPKDFRCPARLGGNRTCSAPMEPVVGFYESDDGGVHGARRVNLSRRTLIRTAMENATETVRQGMLYSLEVIEEGGGDFGILTGILDANPPTDLISDHQQDLVNLLCEHLTSEFSFLSVGSAKTRGLGKVRFEFSSVEIPIFLPLELRFDRLQQAWCNVRPEQADQTVFTLTLNSDAIVLDELWRYSSVLSESVLEREVSGAPLCRLVRCFTNTRIVSGWNSAHQLPKEDELAITKGASFLYTTTTDREALLSWLQSIEERGIGERRIEGFGQVIACHPFHWEVP